MELELSTSGNGDVLDITDAVAARIGELGIVEGSALLFVPGSTGALTAIEYESGAVRDASHRTRTPPPLRESSFARFRSSPRSDSLSSVREGSRVCDGMNL